MGEEHPITQVREIELETHGFRYACRFVECADQLYDPIVFLSGAFQSMRSWEKFISHFGRRTSLALVDVPGVGSADRLPAKYGLDFLAESVARALDCLGLAEVNVFSVSYGSPVGYEFAKRYPNRVAHLLLAGIMKEIPGDFVGSVFRSLAFAQENRADEFASEVVGGLLCKEPTKPVRRRQAVERLFRRQLEQMSSEERARYVVNTLRLLCHSPLDIRNSPNVPTLVFTGEHDPFTKPEYCREIATSFPHAVFTTLREADHLCHMECFETVAELTDRFFGDQPLDEIPGCNAVEHIVSGSGSERLAPASSG